MKVRSGLKDVYQNNLHKISAQSLRTFLNMASVHLSDPELSPNQIKADENEEVEDVVLLGIQKFRLILKEKKIPARFNWGSMKAVNVDQPSELLQ